jgi:hypothetical protein
MSNCGLAHLKAAGVPQAHFVGPVPGPFPLQRSVDELTGLTHPFILYADNRSV